MKNLTSLLLIVPLFSILMVQTVQGQTEDEFRQEFQQYAEQHGMDAARSYAVSRIYQISNNVIWDAQQWMFLENFFNNSTCRAVKGQICEEEFYAKLLEVTALSTAAAGACVLAAVTPITFALCAAAVVIQHQARTLAARRTLQACFLRAYLECLPPPPPPCSILAPEIMPTINKGDPSPSLAECIDPINDPCSCLGRSPIIVDVAGNGFNLTGVANGVMFDMTGITGPERLGWTQANSDDAFLALDLNDNGLIDDGTELFGNFTFQPAPENGEERNGFLALAVYDHNNDGRINNQDGVYSALHLWQDTNHNGISESSELHTLPELGLKTLYLDYRRSRRTDRHGNEFRYRAKVKDTRDAQLGRWAWDVFLVSPKQRG